MFEDYFHAYNSIRMQFHVWWYLPTNRLTDCYYTLWVTDSIRIAHWSGMPNSLLNILPHHFHLKLSLLQEVFSIKNRFLTDWISFYGHSTTICIKGEILSSFIQDKISPLIFSWKVSLNIFSFKNRFWIDWISFYGHRTTICIKGEILSLCSNRLIQYFWPRVTDRLTDGQSLI